MSSSPPPNGSRRPIAIIATILGAGLLALALWSLHAAGLLTGETRSWVALALVCATLAGAALAAAMTRARTARALEAVTSALRDAARGNYERPLHLSAPEWQPARESFESLRTSLRQHTVSRDYLDRLLGSMNDALLITGPDGRIQRANAAATQMFGRAESELLGLPADDLLISDDRRRAPSRPREGTVTRPDGSTVTVSFTVSEIKNDAETEGRVYTAQNIEERKRAEQRIRYLARIDPLTKIANRMQFQHVLQQHIARAHRTQQYLALLYLDVDKFKDINDTFGHNAGDTSLEIFTQRVVAELGRNAHAGRLAGDEFAVLLTGFQRMDDLLKELPEIANRLLRAAGKPFHVRGEEIFLTASMGIAVYPRDGDNVIDLIRNADAALYQAKKAGGNCFEFYSADMNTAAVERLMMKSKLRRAFERDELRLHYQPKYSLKTGRIEGAEALVRWDLPERGLVFPSDFVPLAEETNLILQLGDWVLNRVCADYRSWQRAVPSPCRVAVNLSLRQLQQRRFLEQVRETFRRHGVSPASLELEITETTLMEDPERTVRILDALYSMGLHLAIDDFGTGYSSLSALQQFPISTLKIDRSFVRDVAQKRDDALIVDAIIQMGHSLQLEVVAEGVESADQLEFLRKHGCDYAQGHFFGDPMTAEEFGELLVEDAEGSGKYQTLFA
jgi:diguanylate cyclase (GGDEF)-like protein/PAS domain S-box-containing protein